ncbi:hypothetical protein Tco_0767212 [Tanacetum coccineum]
MFVIEQPLLAAPAIDSNAQVLSEWNALYDAYNEVACLMLGSITLELHRQFENYSPYKMLQELKSMFEKQAGVERFDLIQTFHACKQEEWFSQYSIYKILGKSKLFTLDQGKGRRHPYSVPGFCLGGKDGVWEGWQFWPPHFL